MNISAPARIDLAGGTLDVPPLCFLIRHAATLNIAVNRRVSLSITDARGKLNRAGDITDLAAWPLYNEALTYFGQDTDQLGFQVTGNIPPASGLGGSSSLLVALVRLLNESLGNRPEEKVLLDQVTVLEHRLLGKPAGTQDGIAAIYGGMNWIHYHRGYPVVENVAVPAFLTKNPLLLVYSDQQHHSGINNWSVVSRACEGDPETLRVLNALADNAHAMKESLEASDERGFFETVRTESRLRRDLCPDILNPAMAKFAESVGEGVACKACGAGGGGAMWVYAPGLRLADVADVASRNALQAWEVKIDFNGVGEVSL
ncbi:GHMP family kinase ATP-binding protein [Acanthopleuribacter pedis]|uniref:GHMP kinase N-terminal domain-containing protein n=1 Tax=Acanthopleuribacter pedis TaxID=442870 RepID=A0A8J7QPS8_9BACT|nr:hypothetical protein [Acanthopleuribacter pedis]MBO1322433.1 hypothetical protein [Acanthopleuribacter pedis]